MLLFLLVEASVRGLPAALALWRLTMSEALKTSTWRPSKYKEDKLKRFTAGNIIKFITNLSAQAHISTGLHLSASRLPALLGLMVFVFLFHLSHVSMCCVFHVSIWSAPDPANASRSAVGPTPSWDFCISSAFFWLLWVLWVLWVLGPTKSCHVHLVQEAPDARHAESRTQFEVKSKECCDIMWLIAWFAIQKHNRRTKIALIVLVYWSTSYMYTEVYTHVTYMFITSQIFYSYSILNPLNPSFSFQPCVAAEWHKGIGWRSPISCQEGQGLEFKAHWTCWTSWTSWTSKNDIFVISFDQRNHKLCISYLQNQRNWVLQYIDILNIIFLSFQKNQHVDVVLTYVGMWTHAAHLEIMALLLAHLPLELFRQLQAFSLESASILKNFLQNPNYELWNRIKFMFFEESSQKSSWHLIMFDIVFVVFIHSTFTFLFTGFIGGCGKSSFCLSLAAQHFL